jgi:hypothetical protein
MKLMLVFMLTVTHYILTTITITFFHKRGGNEQLLLQWRHALAKQFKIKFVTYIDPVEL